MKRVKFIALVGVGFCLEAHGQADCLLDANGDGHPFFGAMVTPNHAAPGGTQAGQKQVTSITSGDVNGDGHADVVMLHQGGPLTVNTNSEPVITVYLNEGDGVMTAVQVIVLPTGWGPRSAELGDLDGDGDRDLVFVDEANDTALIYRNDGTGQFTAFGSYTTADEPSSVVIANLDGDGDLDLAVLVRLNNNVSVLKNNGDGTFAAGVAYAAGNVPDMSATSTLMRMGPRMASADIDGDADLDLIVPSVSGYSLLRNTGMGAFAASQIVSVGQSLWTVIATDLNNDGFVDIVGTDLTLHGRVYVALNGGGGSFPNYDVYETDYLYGPLGPGFTFELMGVAAGDLDDDGDHDLLVGHAYRLFEQMLFNDGSGHFGPTPPEFRWVDVGSGDGPGTMQLNDFDGDGRLDLALGRSAGGPGVLRVLLNDGTGTGHIFRAHERVPDLVQFAVPGIQIYPWNTPDSVATADVDGDTDFDLIVADKGGSSNETHVTIVRNPGDGSFAGAATDVYELPVPEVTTDYFGNQVLAVHAADMNGDELPDIVVSDSGRQTTPDGLLAEGSSLWVLLNNGNASFSVIRYLTRQGDQFGTTDSALGDLEGDGDIDVAIVNTSAYSVNSPQTPSQLLLFLNDGVGGMSPGAVYDLGFMFNSRRGVVRLADLDHDGDQDVVVSTTGVNGLRVYHNDGGGALTSIQSLTDYPQPRTHGFIDLDGDEYLDLVAAWDTGTSNSIGTAYLNDGAGHFLPRIDLPFRVSRMPTGADMDGDGVDELVFVGVPSGSLGVPDPDGGGISVAKVGPGLTFDKVVYVSETQPWNFAVADLDNDGKRDVVATCAQYPNLSILWQGCPKVPPPPCPPDINDDQTVNIDDLVQVITNWGPCDIGPPPLPLRRAALGGPGSGPGSGDMNCDFVTDVHDIAPFMLALNDWKQYIEDYPDCDLFNGDMNNSGFPIDQADLAIFCPLAGGVVSGQQCGIALPCPADINDDQVVNIDDLVMIITSWGPCEI